MEAAFDVVLGIDMETDIGSFTDRYEGVRFGTPRLLEIMARRKAKATYFWTGHAAEHNPEMVRAVREAGHETGCHGLQHETLGDPLFPLPNNWPVMPFEVEGRIREATRILAETAGVRPVSFRCPRLWGSTTVVNVLENLGYKADATLPMYHYRSRCTPYHPSAEEWTQEGELRLVEIPNFCDLSMESRDPYGRDRDQWPLFRTASAEALMEKVEGFVRHLCERKFHPVLCFYFHPWEFHEMPRGAIDFGEASVTPLPMITKNCGDIACREFEKLLRLLAERRGAFRTAAEVATDWQ